MVSTIFQVVQAETTFSTALLKCRRAPIETTSVPTLRLSQFLHERRIHHVHYLKIDAQGADRSIVHDVLSNSKVAIDNARQYQLLDRATLCMATAATATPCNPTTAARSWSCVAIGRRSWSRLSGARATATS